MSIVFIILASIIIAALIIYIWGMKQGSNKQNPGSDLDEGDEDEDEM